MALEMSEWEVIDSELPGVIAGSEMLSDHPGRPGMWKFLVKLSRVPGRGD